MCTAVDANSKKRNLISKRNYNFLLSNLDVWLLDVMLTFVLIFQFASSLCDLCLTLAPIDRTYLYQQSSDFPCGRLRARLPFCPLALPPLHDRRSALLSRITLILQRARPIFCLSMDKTDTSIYGILRFSWLCNNMILLNNFPRITSTGVENTTEMAFR